MKSKLKLLIVLFWIFFKIAPVTFGGGYAMIPLIERQFVHKKQWLNMKDVSDIFALSGTAPGAIAVNCATFIGYRFGGVLGAIAALAGVLFPTVIIVCFLSIFFILFKDNSYFESAFLGIRAAVVALILYAAIEISKTALLDKSTFILCAGMVVMMLVFHLHPIIAIFLGALFGIMIVKVKKRLGIAVRLEKIQEPQKGKRAG
ncbi:chromate transporter [Bacillus salipaludis]|uniref:Chromate transporter n=1 Tax=Bacillus salipaludis TaxID=2547811 RepID=A0AA90TTZ4_9BACI|nr:chromate transporter [Bacillus salipaludis]MDQ6598544.1 chromate transporter [Bacillus salipaludis]